MYRVRIVAVAASPLRGRGRVRIKSRDQHSRDLATLGPEVPLGHPTVRTPFCYQEDSSTRCKTESEVNRPQIQLLQDAGEISAHPPLPFRPPFLGIIANSALHTPCCQLCLFCIRSFRLSCFSQLCIFYSVRNISSCYPDESSKRSLW